MQRQARYLWLVSALLLALAPPALAQHNESLDANFLPVPGVRELSGRLIVQPKSAEALAAQGLDKREAERRVRQAKARLEPNLVKSFDAVSEFVVRVPGHMTDKQYAEALLATGAYEYVEPDWLVTPAGLEPNDLYYIDQWYLPHLGLDWAWLYTQGDPSVVVAVVDTGVDSTHPDLATNMVPGYNAVDEVAQTAGGLTSDIFGHGTRVAGIVAAAGNNNIGVTGVGWHLSIMPIRASNNSTTGVAHVSDLNAGARWAIENGAKVANVSYNGVNSASIETTGAYIRSIGGMLIWAVGNGSIQFVSFDHPSVIVVSATDVFDQFTAFSNYGELVDIAAPGTPIRTTLNGGGYTYVSGTSYATPIVSGIAALMWCASPTLSPEEVESALYATAIDLGEPGEDIYFGHGLVQAFDALKTSRNCPADMVTSSTTQPPPDGVVNGADLAYLLSQWGPVQPSLADIASSDTFAFPADGIVDGADLARLLSTWGNCQQ